MGCLVLHGAIHGATHAIKQEATDVFQLPTCFLLLVKVMVGMVHPPVWLMAGSNVCKKLAKLPFN